MYADDSIHIEKTDQCYTCDHFMKGVMCPLLEALALGVVELTSDMTVQNCGFYQQHARHLRVVEGQAGSPDSEEPTAAEEESGSSQNRSCS